MTLGRSARLGPLALALALSACGPAAPSGPREAAVAVAVVAGPGGPALTRVQVAAAPSGASADLVRDAGDGRWRGTLAVDAGVSQTLTATAFAEGEVVGTGTAAVAVSQHETAVVAITILDATGRPPGADHGPIVAAVTAAATPVYGAPVSLAVSAVDPDADALAFAWSASCAGAFSAASSAMTDWTPAATGACTVTAAVSSRGLTRSGALALTVAPPVPELTIVEDADYPLANDPRSTYPYRIDSASYANLGTTATAQFGPEKQVRLVRYVVSNPGPLPVAIDAVNVPGAWKLMEIWGQHASAGAGGESALGTTCPSLAEDGLGYVLTPWCLVGEVYPGELGPGSDAGICEPVLDSGMTLTPATTAAVGRALALDAAGVEGGLAPKLGLRTLVPAASGGLPGRIALYLSRPLANRSVAASWDGSAWTLAQRVWSKTSVPPGPMECPEGGEGEWDAVWDLYVRPQRLDAAQDWLVGSFVLTAYATNGSAVIGPATPVATVTFTRTIPH